MSHTITIRLTKDLAEWLERTAAGSGRSQGAIVRDQLQKARAGASGQAYMRLAGTVKGPATCHREKAFPVVKGIADTGLLVAFANRDDDHHAWAVQIAEAMTEPLLTCEAVLAETAFHLRRRCGDRHGRRRAGDGGL